MMVGKRWDPESANTLLGFNYGCSSGSPLSFGINVKETPVWYFLGHMIRRLFGTGLSQNYVS